MGGTSWSDAAYTARSVNLKSAGLSAFEYDADVRSGAAPAAAHTAMDPSKLKGGARESRDSDAHPCTTPVAVGFDVTGSMHQVPRTVQEKLPTLLGLLLRQGYLTDPAILVAGIGDATTDTAPLQIGQFESGNEIDLDLAKIWLEGGGGGQQTESYELFLYFLARKTKCDAFEKRGKKGYAFIIGDEMPYNRVKAVEVKKHFGDEIGEDIPVEQIVKEVREKWEVFFLLPNLTSYYNDETVHSHWKKLLGQNFIRLDDPNAVAEFIAAQIGVAEDTLDHDTAADTLKAHGTDVTVANAVAGALVKTGSGDAGFAGTGLTAP